MLTDLKVDISTMKQLPGAADFAKNRNYIRLTTGRIEAVVIGLWKEVIEAGP